MMVMERERDAEQRVLDIVRELVLELGGPAALRRVALDDSLDRDLGIGSLERVELLLRIEKELGVRLADDVMEDAASPRDLVTAVLAAEPARAEIAMPRHPVRVGAAEAAP